MRAALVHDWLVGIGGAEKALEAMAHLYPGPIHTLVHAPKKMQGSSLAKLPIHTSFLQKLPAASKIYRHLLPLFPLAIEQFDVSGYDLILSNSHAVAKGVLTHAEQLHICYCHTPMRYAWDLTHQYLNSLGTFKRLLARPALHALRRWDVASAPRVDAFIANSHYIKRRIRKVYGREATVIYPPVATHLYAPTPRKEEFYLAVSRLVPYKKIDLIVQAFAEMPEKRLVVIGDGPERALVRRHARKNIELLGFQGDLVVREMMAQAKAFVFAAEEDFGIVPVEAQAAGTPVIAYGRGGACETVVDGKTGLFFDAQTVPALIDAVERFEKMSFDPQEITKHAQQFSAARFELQFKAFVEQEWEKFNSENRRFSRR